MQHDDPTPISRAWLILLVALALAAVGAYVWFAPADPPSRWRPATTTSSRP